MGVSLLNSLEGKGQKEEIDIIHAHNSHVLPIEVKIREKIGREDVKTLFKFIEKNNLKKALLITLNTETRFQKDKLIVEAIPYWRYWSIRTRIL